MSEKVSVSELKAGDVLLFRKKSIIGSGIRFFDGGKTNHAALFLGEDSISEAVANGVKENLLSDALKDDKLKRIIVRRLAKDVQNMDPVLNVSAKYIQDGTRYAYEQNVFLAVLCLTRRITPTKILGRLIRRVLDSAVTVLIDEYIGSKDAMICSEFVYRCYDEAIPDIKDPYTLRINWITMNKIASPLLLAPSNDLYTDSLLAWASTQELARSSPGPKILSGLSPLSETEYIPLDDSENDLEYLLEEYAQEIRRGEFVPMEKIQTPEILSSIKHFAEKYNQATKNTVNEEYILKGLNVTNIPDVVRMLFRTSADLVTPKDLEDCVDLATIGDLKVGA